MKTSKYLRKASRNFLCECCSRPINKGEEYIDFEAVDFHSNNSVTITHRRIHKHCDNAKIKYSKEDLPKPVVSGHVKEWLVGKIVFEGKWYLLTREWVTTKYHKRSVVYNCDGNSIAPEDVEV